MGKAKFDKEAALKELCGIPGVGKSIAEDLYNIGIRRINDLKGESPDALYQRSCAYQGAQIDRCLLYTFRCAVYFATNRRHAPELLKWWNWSDENIKKRHG